MFGKQAGEATDCISRRASAMAALRPLELVASLFAHAAGSGADVATLGESDLGVPAHLQALLAAPGALAAVRLRVRRVPPRALTRRCAGAARGRARRAAGGAAQRQPGPLPGHGAPGSRSPRVARR